MRKIDLYSLLSANSLQNASTPASSPRLSKVEECKRCDKECRSAPSSLMRSKSSWNCWLVSPKDSPTFSAKLSQVHRNHRYPFAVVVMNSRATSLALFVLCFDQTTAQTGKGLLCQLALRDVSEHGKSARLIIDLNQFC